MTYSWKHRVIAGVAALFVALAGATTTVRAEGRNESTGASAAWLVAQQSIAAGEYFSCAITEAGGVQCWGRNYFGQLGDGTNTASSTPVDVVGLTDVVQITAGYATACAVTAAGAAYCWGVGTDGQLGDGNNLDSNEPVQPTGLSSGVAQISAGDEHVCAVMTTGALKCWGSQSYGELGTGDVPDPHSTPADVLGSGVVSVQALYYMTCMLMTDHSVKCMGDGGSGNLGTGNADNAEVPTAATELGTDVKAFALGYNRLCWISIATGGVKCLGTGGMGDGSTNSSTTPVNVAAPLDSGVVALSGTEGEMCALTSAGAVYCWGSNDSGQIGDGTSDNRDVPTLAVGLSSGIIAVTHGYGHVIAVRTNGTMTCWGQNWTGQLGDGTTTDSDVPLALCGIVVPHTAPEEPPTLPGTGSNSETILWTALAALAIGSLLVRVQRRTQIS